MKPEEVSDITGYQVIGSASISRGKKLVVIRIARDPYFGKFRDEICDFPKYESHIEKTISQALPVAKVRPV